MLGGFHASSLNFRVSTFYDAIAKSSQIWFNESQLRQEDEVLEKLIIVGENPLQGKIKVSGSKNAALPILAATLLVPGRVNLRNIPNLVDIHVLGEIIQDLGGSIKFANDSHMEVDASKISSHVADYELVTRMRASFFILGPLLGRLKKAKIPLPGGCAIGSRPVDIHLKGLQALGAEVRIEHGYVIAEAKALVGTRIYLDYPSVGATENIMMAAVLAQGETLIENSAQEPEITDLANFLNACGAQIEGAGTEKIRIVGVSALKPVSYQIIPDRIEAGTFIIASAMTGGKMEIEGADTEHLAALLGKLKEIGIGVETQKDGMLQVVVDGELRATDIKTLPYPGFPTDLQAQMMPLLCSAKGTSVITETVFENRFMHIAELCRMGASIKVEGSSAIIKGGVPLTGAPVTATDLRAGAALVVAGLAARGQTEISGLHHLDRGYDNLVNKLASVGAVIKRIEV